VRDDRELSCQRRPPWAVVVEQRASAPPSLSRSLTLSVSLAHTVSLSLVSSAYLPEGRPVDAPRLRHHPFETYVLLRLVCFVYNEIDRVPRSCTQPQTRAVSSVPLRIGTKPYDHMSTLYVRTHTCGRCEGLCCGLCRLRRLHRLRGGLRSLRPGFGLRCSKPPTGVGGATPPRPFRPADSVHRPVPHVSTSIRRTRTPPPQHHRSSPARGDAHDATSLTRHVAGVSWSVHHHGRLKHAAGHLVGARCELSLDHPSVACRHTFNTQLGGACTLVLAVVGSQRVERAFTPDGPASVRLVQLRGRLTSPPT
jgi:hypothetical protein